ncbi:hypothetical protein [Cryobacterium zhongshanensis]|uniref:Uncharacterized protein n=1 Tax=Cryobacterium zhongshanensis TaxID=2928153 RepID=A0AA41UH00_9MICO|nr:hypothetical protein [Cryobacterium zhongshanensis]MCI4659752.1 hypothetical protein [Cryobacterium zhongshanensis]
MHPQLKDQIDMPDYNPAANAGRGAWGLRDVSEGTVTLHPTDIVRCVDHGAMNSVSATRTLWRCLTCGRAAYRPLVPNLALSLTSTTLPGGMCVPVFAYDDGRSVLGLGHMENEKFLRHASLLLEVLGIDFNELDAGGIIRRYALLREEADGSLTIMWNVWGTWERVTETTAGAMPVTLIEI